MSKSFIKRKINLTFQLGQGNFGEGNSTELVLTGLRVVAGITQTGGPGVNRATLQVYGLTPDQMNTLSFLGLPNTFGARKNIVIIEAGDDENGMSICYQGYMTNSWQALNSQPNTYLEVQSMTSILSNVKPVKAISFAGSADVASIMAGIAKTQGVAFENNGVNQKISNQYLSGTAHDQANTLKQHAGIEMHLDSKVLAIWPRGGSRGGGIPLISPATGMVGYPKYSPQGMQFRTMFNSALVIGGKIEMESSLVQANGKWTVNSIAHDLASETNNGPWFTDVGCWKLQGE